MRPHPRWPLNIQQTLMSYGAATVDGPPSLDGATVMQFFDTYEIVFSRGPYLAGVHEADSLEAARQVWPGNWPLKRIWKKIRPDAKIIGLCRSMTSVPDQSIDVNFWDDAPGRDCRWRQPVLWALGFMTASRPRPFPRPVKRCRSRTFPSPTCKRSICIARGTDRD
jgi:hypothetical protein